MQLGSHPSTATNSYAPALRHVNPHLVCGLCNGYLIDATTLTSCIHSFCRSCLLKYLRSNKSKLCPTCRDNFKAEIISDFRRDRLLQRMVYKLVPGLYKDEINRRRTFNTKSDVNPSTDKSRHENLPRIRNCRYQQGIEMTSDVYSGEEYINVCLLHCDNFDEIGSGEGGVENDLPVPAGDRRYLQCPARFTVGHLKKYLQFKFGIENKFEVDMFIGKLSLEDSLSLIDVAYSYYNKKVPDMTLQYVVSIVQLSAMRTHDHSLMNCHRPPSPVSKPVINQQTAITTNAALTITNGVRPLTGETSPLTSKMRTPTSRIRKRMINDAFSTKHQQHKAAKVRNRCQVDEERNVLIRSAPHSVCRPSADELVQIDSETDQMHSSTVNPDTSGRSDYSLDSPDVDECVAVVKRTTTVTEDETCRRINGEDIADNTSDVMSAALKTFVADSAFVLTLNDIDRFAASGADKWLSKSIGRASVMTTMTDMDTLIAAENGRVRDDMAGELSEGSSDIDGEIRKIAADVTCSSHYDDINSVISDEDQRCSRLSMTSPYGSDNLELSVGFETLSKKKPCMMFECTVDGSDIATQISLSPPPELSEDSKTARGGIIDNKIKVSTCETLLSSKHVSKSGASKPFSETIHVEDHSMSNGNLQDTTAHVHSSVLSNQPKSSGRTMCFLGSPPYVTSAASSVNVILSTTYMSKSTTSPTSILKTLFGHSTTNTSSLDTRNVCILPVHCETEKPVSKTQIGSLTTSASSKNSFVAAVKVDGVLTKVAKDKSESSDTIARSTACVENLVSSSTDSIASQSGGETAVNSASDVTGDLIQQQKRLSETLLLNKGNFSATATFSSLGFNTLQSSSCAVRAQLEPTLKLNGNLSTNAEISEKSLLGISDPYLVHKTPTAKSTPNDVEAHLVVSDAPVSLTQHSIATGNNRPYSCETSKMAGASSSHASVGTQTNTDLLGRYFRRRVNPVNSFIPGSNGRHLRSTNLICNSNVAAAGLRDRMARAGLKTAQTTIASGSSAFSFGMSTAAMTSSTASTKSTVYFTSGPQGNPVIVPVPAMTPVNINNKGTFLIALPANFTLPSSVAGGIICPTVSVSSIGVSKVGTTTNTGGTLTVCPVLLKTGNCSVATSRTTAVVINRSVSGPPLQVMVTPSPKAVGLSAVTGFKSVQTLNKCTPISQTIKPVSSGSMVMSDRLGLRGFSRISSGPRLSKELNNGGTLRFERISSSIEQVPRVSDNTVLSTSRQTTQAPTIIYCSRPIEVQGQVLSQKPDSQMSPLSTSIDSRNTVSMALANKQQLTISSPVMSKVAITTVPATSQLVTPETGSKGLISSPISVAVTRVSGARHTFIANMPQLTPPKKTPTTTSNDVAHTSPSSAGDVAITAAVCSRGHRMEGAPVSFIRAILERSIASPAAYGSFVDDDRCCFSPDHVTSTASNGDEYNGTEAVSTPKLTVAHAAASVVDASGQLLVASATKTNYQVMSDLRGSSPSSVSPTVKRSSPFETEHANPAAKRSRGEGIEERGHDAALASSSCSMTSSYSQPTITMESMLAKYAKQNNSTLSVPSLSPKASSPGNACSEVSAVCSYRDDEVGKQLQAMHSVGSARITRSGMVALPKKIYAYLGSAMSHEHIANQLVPGSPSPVNNGCSLDSSDGLVPASPTSSSVASGRLSIESITSSDDGPIRQLRLMCNGLQNTVQ